MLNRCIFLLRKKGLSYVYNYLWLNFFYGRGTPLRRFLLRLLYLRSAYPRALEIENTTRCNLRCIICEHSYWDEPGRDMGLSAFKQILDQFPPLKFLGLTGIGESLLNKNFMGMLELTRARSKHTIIELYETFFLLEPQVSRRLIELGVDHIYLSFDAAGKQTYEKIRAGSNFERVIHNVQQFMLLKKQLKTEFPELTIHFIICKTNINELGPAVRLARSLGINRIYFTKLLHAFAEVKQLMPEDAEVESAIQQARREGQALEVEIVANPNVYHQKPPLRYCNNWIMPFIFADGSVLPCCAANEANSRPFQKEHSFGNIFKQDFQQIWFGEKFKRFRKQISRGETPEYCQHCPMYDTQK